MMPNFTFEVKPIAVRKQNTKRDNLARHYLPHSIEVTAALGKVGDEG